MYKVPSFENVVESLPAKERTPLRDITLERDKEPIETPPYREPEAPKELPPYREPARPKPPSELPQYLESMRPSPDSHRHPLPRESYRESPPPSGEAYRESLPPPRKLPTPEPVKAPSPTPEDVPEKVLSLRERMSKFENRITSVNVRNHFPVFNHISTLKIFSHFGPRVYPLGSLVIALVRPCVSPCVRPCVRL